MLTATDCMQLI